ncbi:multidrug efflux SMR transporter [Burkholderia dolosa]|uniref:Spermidine export protein MdtI n=1 Tax=Burkholderia dolosa TaxID=152500 RepID=A0A892IFH3_9BURK|nr:MULTISPECIES: multidrug efflux SMR transporter [Burkholderia]AKE05367.1 ligand-binding protein SH3 [Burkholderia cepacia]AJY09939.1 small Multidrug Resistance family protein [Burkholderia dolosa AU0158]AYZ94315.1 multidrug efflux SMR transporter [Burkholderia dolosa]ETP61939.1 multidrug transporter [Burkholderia dolosa PC543]MBR8313204.1 multidrug efflux SMR transporter [Burkholderia dolosa]
MKTSAIVFVAVSAAIDIAANMMLEKSDGFRRRAWGAGAIVLLWIAFALLGQAVKSIDLPTAYAMWGGIGILGTALCAKVLYRQHLKPIGWVGIVLVIVAVVLLSTAE